MTTHDKALAEVGLHNGFLLDSVGRRLHNNESSHMHDSDDEHQGCRYCWNRATIAIAALRDHELALPAFDDPPLWHQLIAVHADTDGGLYSLQHPNACRQLPPGVYCWADINGLSDNWPTEPGTYRIRPAHGPESVKEFLAGHIADAEIQCSTGPDSWTAWPPPGRPYGWALWDLVGALHQLVPSAPDGPADGWVALAQIMFAKQVQEYRQMGWTVDGISEEHYRLLETHTGFQVAGSRAAFLAEGLAAAARAARGGPEPYGYASWAADGTLLACGRKEPGLGGWHSLGIASPAQCVVLTEINERQLRHLNSAAATYSRPGGHDRFHMEVFQERIDEEIPAPDFEPPSKLAHGFADVINRCSAEEEFGNTPDIVLGQYLEECLRAYGRALVDRGRLAS